jgi:hypothetical protein
VIVRELEKQVPATAFLVVRAPRWILQCHPGRSVGALIGASAHDRVTIFDAKPRAVLHVTPLPTILTR